MVLLLASSTEDDPQLATPQGGPRQFSLVDSSTLSGGAFPSVANIAALSALVVTSFPPGQLAYVQSVHAYWSLQPATEGVSVDGITIANASNGGLWIRVLQADAEASQQLQSWALSTNTGSDENAGTLAAPLATFQEFARRLGGWEPDIDNDVTMQVLDYIAPVGDFLNFTPRGSGSLSFIFPTGPSQQAFAGALAGVTPKNTAAGVGQPLTATAYAGAAIGQLVVNHTRGNSVANVLLVTGGVVTFSQPLTPAPVPPGFNIPSEVDTWVTGDNVTAYTLVDVRLLNCGFTFDTFGEASATGQIIYRANLLGPNGIEPSYVADVSTLTECSFGGELACNDIALNVNLRCCGPSTDQNTGGSISGGATTVATIGIDGGGCNFLDIFGATLANGFVIQGLFLNDLSRCNLRDVFIGAGTQVEVIGPPTSLSVPFLVWGNGTLNVQGGATLRTSGSAAATLRCQLQIDNLATAWAVSSTAGVITIAGPRALTAANLDALVTGGGFTDATAYGISGFTASNGHGSTITNISP